MPQRWDCYLPDVPRDELNNLVRQWPVAEPSAPDWVHRVLETGAQCRLAFAFILDAADPLPSFGFPPEAIISETEYGVRRGRPRTARWAFWAAYVLCEELNLQGHRPSMKELAKLISILLGRATPPSEVRKILKTLRREAAQRATASAQWLLSNKLQRHRGHKDFRVWLQNRYSEGLEPTTEFPPIIEHGQVSAAWLDTVGKTRRAILTRVGRSGPLAGASPLVWLASSSRLVSRFPLGGDPGIGGRVHLGKALEVPTPHRPFEGGTTSISFPRHWFENPPTAAVLYAVPAYWHPWFELFGARPRTLSPS